MRKLLVTTILTCTLCAGMAQFSSIDSLKQLLQTTKRDTVRVRLLLEVAYKYMNQNSDSSLKYAHQAYAIANESSHPMLELTSLNGIANAFHAAGNYTRALQYYLEALKRAEALGVRERISTAQLNVGNLYTTTGRYREALDYYFRSKKIREELKNEYRLGNCLANIGDTYEKLNILDSARLFTIMADAVAMPMTFLIIPIRSILK